MARDPNLVRTPLGGKFSFLNKEEKIYFENSFQEFKKRYDFEHPADLTALENLLIAQLLAYRYSQWLAKQSDYDGNPIDEASLLTSLLNIQNKINNLMAVLGISRRERVENLSAQEIISRIAKRAKEYGLHKNKVAWEFLVRSYRIRDVLETYKRMGNTERKRFGYLPEQVIEKIIEILKPLEEMEQGFLKDRNLWKAELKGEIKEVG